MQPKVIPPRETLTEDDVVGLIRDASGVTIGRGCELLDLSLSLIEDITPDFVGGSVSRASYANLHGTASLSVSRELPFGWAILRPFITLTDGTTLARFNLGAYFTNTPERSLAESPVTYDVECYDILSVLDDQVGNAYAVAEGAGYLAAIEAILIGRGVTQYIIDQHASASVLPTDRVWAFDDNTTWLLIVNNLLSSIGYAGIWSDWDGRLRCQPYVTPSSRGPEWTYDTSLATSMLGLSRVAERDFKDAPNQWVFVRQNDIDGSPPIEGDGVYTYVNQQAGDTSVAGRRRTITKKVSLDAADHASLVASAQRTIDADTNIPVKIRAETSPNPLHWHFDILYLDDPEFGPACKLLATQWTLPLDSGNQTHEWTVLAS